MNRNYDEITFQGFGGATRSIKTHYAQFRNLLRTGYTVRTMYSLWSNVLPAERTDTAGDVMMISKVELPDMRSYTLKYNDYQELAEVTLPTGGVIQYDWAGGTSLYPNGAGNPPATGMAYRRLTERRTYTSAGVLEGKTTYANSDHGNYGSVPTQVTVTHRDASGNPMASEDHWFYSNPIIRPINSLSFPGSHRTPRYHWSGPGFPSSQLFVPWQHRQDQSHYAGTARTAGGNAGDQLRA